MFALVQINPNILLLKLGQCSAFSQEKILLGRAALTPCGLEAETHKTMLGDDIQNDLCHHLSKDGDEADWPIISYVLLLALFEEGSNIGFSPLIEHLSSSP